MINLLDEFDKSNGFSHAILTTYAFDPGFFEERILKTNILRTCPNIIILIDENKYQDICKDPAGGRQINRRYMLIPVRMSNPYFGVFHPKLWLFAGKDKARLFVGSTNLTRPGITSNFEMISAVEYNIGGHTNGYTKLFKDSHDFIEKILQEYCFYSDTLLQSLKQMSIMTPVFAEKHSEDGNVKIIHNLETPILDQYLNMSSRVSGKLRIISPYFDNHIGEILDSISNKIDIKKVELFIQQNTNTLNIGSLQKWLEKSIDIPFDIYKMGLVGRKLHAKLLLIESEKQRMGLIGSANFTKPALLQNSSRGNIELCLTMIDEAAEAIDRAFNENIFTYEKIDVKDIISMVEQADCLDSVSPIKLYQAEYCPKSSVIRSYCKFEPNILTSQARVKMLIKKVDSEYTDAVIDLLEDGDKAKGRFDFKIDSRSASLFSQATSVAVLVSYPQKEYISNHVWLLNVVDVNVSIDNNNKKILKQFRECGKGLVAFINNYIEQGMIDKAISMLEDLTIKYDSTGRSGTGRPILRKVHSPKTDDEIPLDIWKMSSKQRTKLSKAMSDFFVRHYQNVLKKHLRKPNLNGIENFLDVMETCANVGMSAVQNNVLNRSDVYSYILSGFEMFVGNNLQEGFFRELWCKYYDIKDRLKVAFSQKRSMERIIAYSLVLRNISLDKKNRNSDFITIQNIYELSSKDYIRQFYEFAGINNIDLDAIDNIIEDVYDDNRVLKTRFAKNYLGDISYES